MSTIEELRAIARRIGALTMRYHTLKHELRSREAGKYEDGVTIYSVRDSRVRGHTRHGYTAVRVNSKNKRKVMAN